MHFGTSCSAVVTFSSNAHDFDSRVRSGRRVSSRTSPSNYKEILRQSFGRSLYAQIPEEAAGCRLPLPPSLPLVVDGERKEDSVENSSASVSGQFRVPMAPAASYDFHVDGQAAIAAKRAPSLPPPPYPPSPPPPLSRACLTFSPVALPRWGEMRL